MHARRTHLQAEGAEPAAPVSSANQRAAPPAGGRRRAAGGGGEAGPRGAAGAVGSSRPRCRISSVAAQRLEQGGGDRCLCKSRARVRPDEPGGRTKGQSSRGCWQGNGCDDVLCGLEAWRWGAGGCRSTWESPGSAEQDEVSGGGGVAGGGGRWQRRKLWSGRGILERTWSRPSDDKARGVGGRRGLEVKVTGGGGAVGRRDRPGSAPSPPRPPQHLLCSLIAPALWASEPSFWGSLCPPDESHVLLRRPLLPSVLLLCFAFHLT